ncbi:hypothetical protein CP532_2722 [Ophiocordyceps camponoti-leonardi (nom. inval.)]|nr:hypothetical protein CP532_2722 [Ophiocordyceps camponoti-leonardi (nom. inval.)]
MAQKYCHGRFGEWDDKITTPPGLYLLSNLFPQALKAAGMSWEYSCETNVLRSFNVVALAVLAYLSLLCRRRIEAGASPRYKRLSTGFDIHSACNIALFPLLFFFSGLYYTDVTSTAVILAGYLNHLDRVSRERSSLRSDLLTIMLGLLALLMRQTNIFWVAVYMGGLEVIYAVKALSPGSKHPPVMGTKLQRLQHAIREYSIGHIHDPPLYEAWTHDIFLMTLSFGIAALCNPVRVLRQIWPYVTVLGAFAAFIVWNGGVVLDFPLMKEGSTILLRWIYFVMMISLGVVIVRFNTLIHPFTLADNRHYMFYVFRYSISRGPWIRYLLLLPYFWCREMIMGALAGCSEGRRDAHCPRQENLRSATGSSEAEGDAAQTGKLMNKNPLQYSSQPICSSTGTMWLLATSLSLVTTSLVEPRYFIVPWILWRLMVPEWRPVGGQDGAVNVGGKCRPKKASGLFQQHDMRLIGETVWFAVVNLATCYAFIGKPFVWKDAAGGVLDDGRLQRFMW